LSLKEKLLKENKEKNLGLRAVFSVFEIHSKCKRLLFKYFKVPKNKILQISAFQDCA
jgi:hypothetical protein